jgi:vacuolar-type H+-ATPase subunit I/STV1
MEEKKRRVSERSLENLKLGAESRRQGKIRQNVTILPEILEWLRGIGNVSGGIDNLVAAAKKGDSDSNSTHDWIKDKQPVFDDDSDDEEDDPDLDDDSEPTADEVIKTQVKNLQSLKAEVSLLNRELTEVKEARSQLETELEEVRSQLEKSQALEKDLTEQIVQLRGGGLKVAEILKAIRPLKSRQGVEMKEIAEKAIEVIENL